MIDPRLGVAGKRLAGISRILPVTGGKGGIGKSACAALMALELAARGKRVGLLDLDFTGPCGHVFLGIDDRFPAETFGVEPVSRNGVQFMSISLFAGDAAAPLRGEDLTHALLEMLAITRWGELDILVVDMPPGLGDLALDAVRLIERAEYVVVATASRVVLETVRRNLDLLKRLDRKVAGVIENMHESTGHEVEELAAAYGHRFLGAIPRDSHLEAAIGDGGDLIRTVAGAGMRSICDELAL